MPYAYLFCRLYNRNMHSPFGRLRGTPQIPVVSVRPDSLEMHAGLVATTGKAVGA